MKIKLKYIIITIIIIIIAAIATFSIKSYIYNKEINEQMKTAIHSITMSDNTKLFSNKNLKKKISELPIGTDVYILESFIGKNGNELCKVKANGKVGYMDPQKLDKYKKTTMKKELMLDVSKFNLQNDFKSIGKFKTFIIDNNIQYVYIRAGGRGYGEAGKFYTDPNYKEYSDACEYLGINFGYYFLDEAITSSEVDEEVNFINNFLSENKYENNKLPIAIDVEKHVEKGRADDIWDIRYLLVDELIRKLEQSGNNAILYSNANIADKYLAAVNAKMWLAYYPDINEVTNYWYSDLDKDGSGNQELMSKLVAWQFTEKGIKNKIDKNVDISLVYTCFFEKGSMNDINNDITGKSEVVKSIFKLKNKKKNKNIFSLSNANNI